MLSFSQFEHSHKKYHSAVYQGCRHPTAPATGLLRSCYHGVSLYCNENFFNMVFSQVEHILDIMNTHTSKTEKQSIIVLQ